LGDKEGGGCDEWNRVDGDLELDDCGERESVVELGDCLKALC